MSPLLGPILAQLVTLGLGDRTEVRRVVTDDSYSEAMTAPRANLSFGWKHTTLSLGYGPMITVSGLEESHPNLLVFHTGALAASYRWQHTTLTLSEGLGMGEVNFRSQALAGPIATPGPTLPVPANSGMTPTTGVNPGQSPNPGLIGNDPRLAIDQNLTFVTSSTSLTLTQVASARLTLTGALTYWTGGAIGAHAELYPVTRGPGASASASYLFTRQDTLRTSLLSQFASSTNGNRVWYLTANEGWTHSFSKSATGSLGSGLSISRNSLPDGTVYYSIYPNFLASVGYATRLGRSMLGTTAGVTSSPYIDPVRARADPRLSVNAGVSLSKDRFSSSLSAYTSLALFSDSGQNVLSSVNGNFNVAYRLTDALSVDSGARATWQSYGGQTSIPISTAIYAGLTLGLSVPLSGRK